MNKPSSFIWMVFILLLILPTPAGKLIINLAGGIFLLISLITLVLGGLGWITWKRIQSNMQTCEACGSSFLNNQNICPVCGTKMKIHNNTLENTPASAATIDIKSQNID